MMCEVQSAERKSGGMLQLTPDFHDAPSNVLQSFPAVRKKVFLTLYGTPVAENLGAAGDGQIVKDKSPKGSVDIHIQALVDLINSHPSYATLSSCSGRITLFDASGTSEKNPTNVDSQAESDSVDAECPQGKGFGTWLLSAHEPVVLDDVHSVFQNITTMNGGDISSQSAVTITLSGLTHHICWRFEPMLLHVAAASLQRGQQLLQVALQMGFRESGLITGNTRVTVAIRSYSLALTVPLPTELNRWSDTYLSELVDQSNRRLLLNWQRLNRLYNAVKTSLFRAPNIQLSAYNDRIPALRLWNHAAVCLGREVNWCWEEVLVFGGYGVGPEVETVQGLQSPPPRTSQPKRSAYVFRLKRGDSGWDEQWHVLTIDASFIQAYHLLGIEVKKYDWSAREGCACCTLSLSGYDAQSKTGNKVVAIHGGRTSPAHPLADLVLLDYSKGSSTVQFCSPVHVKGRPPKPRWGHSLTSLSGDCGELAVMIGGRNQNSVIMEDPIYVLRQVADSEQTLLHWEELSFQGNQFCRFHHTTVVVAETVFVFGGIRNANDVLELFSSEESFRDDAVFGFMIERDIIMLVDIDVDGRLEKRFGSSAQLISRTSNDHRQMDDCRVLLIGGVTGHDSSHLDEHVSAFQMVSLSQKCSRTWNLATVGVESVLPPGAGPLVHHTTFQFDQGMVISVGVVFPVLRLVRSMPNPV